jgi:hypothetical protein
MVYSRITNLLMTEHPFFLPPFVGAILLGPSWKGGNFEIEALKLFAPAGFEL